MVTFHVKYTGDEREGLGDHGSSSGGGGGGGAGGSVWWWAKEVVPILNWEMKTFKKPVLAVLILASIALFPSIFLPSTPSMWVAGMTFGYGFGFLLIIGGMIIGTSLPYFIGSLFYHKIEEWLERFPKKASILRLAGEGNWFNQFKAVILLRISPFPYVVYNYCAVATGVRFGPYLFGTLVGVVPEVLVAIYTRDNRGSDSLRKKTTAERGKTAITALTYHVLPNYICKYPSITAIKLASQLERGYAAAATNKNKSFLSEHLFEIKGIQLLNL
ncbi:hypothetical protein L1987_71939 [Smallanthus sonchifolius]|uniref:Uncharacterized protein n=1 Tax=Smallanthus sonchifolius TaxID=185202 RepID=A0ACB9AT07_9ASTR|nr:hypothetical protein L1987_71939 [Smallanthus sonchifolius]